METFKLISIQETDGSPTGTDSGFWWVIKTLEAKVGQFVVGYMCPVRRGIVVQEQELLVNYPYRFSFKMSFNCTSRDG
jgi:hypothetical protein